VKNYTFHFEAQTLLEQFVAAFNDIVIKRYDNQDTTVSPTSGFKVNFVYSPKQRLYATLNTPAPGGLTVPCVAVSINGISRDNTRVFNKLEGFTVPNFDIESGNYVKNIPQPVPVNIGVNMTIVTKFQADMDQILSNFIPYCDPYIIISWKLPFAKNFEIRSEVLWSGQTNVQYPSDIGPTQAFRISADTSFTIKGWLFKKTDEIVKRIYTIDEKFFISNNPTKDYFNLPEL
jgi:hypothetical protein